MNKLVRAVIFIMCVSLFGAPAYGVARSESHTVIIDPGHGGRDYGAVGELTNEKTINLNVGLAVRELLGKRKALKIVMTREDDRFIELQERANIANRNHGDLFVSIHVNSVARSNKNRRNIAGASVYALGLHRSAANLEVAKRENAVMELEADYSTKYQGFDPNSTESYIMFELSQNKHLDQSIRFAEMAESRLCTTAGRRNRGVLQAGFWVLHASAMPAVLIELDFICNPTSERYLNSKKGVRQMANAIANAILEYFGDGPVFQIDMPEENGEKEEEQEQTPDPCPEENAPAEALPADGITYRVQFMAVDRDLGEGSHEFRGLERVESYRQGGLYKYTSGGDFASEADAENYAQKHVRRQFPQAFVIKMQNGKRIQ